MRAFCSKCPSELHINCSEVEGSCFESFVERDVSVKILVLTDFGLINMQLQFMSSS